MSDKLTFVPDLIVTRHKGAVDWIAAMLPLAFARAEDYWGFGHDPEAGLFEHQFDPGNGDDPYTDYRMSRHVPVEKEVTADDVRGKIVIGVLPMGLAALCRQYHAIEFGGPPPRGAEYTAADMKVAGARLVRYVVLTDDERRITSAALEALEASGFGPVREAPHGALVALARKV